MSTVDIPAAARKANASFLQEKPCVVCGVNMVRSLDWLFRCPACRFEQSLLLPGAGRGIDGLQTLRRRNFRTIISELGRLRNLEALTCLEVGCAEGWFIEEMREARASMSAVEPSDQAVELQKRGLDVVRGYFPAALTEQARFDLIVFNDVFEHLPDPVNALKRCEHHLNDDGILLLNLPNSSGFFYRVATALSKIGVRAPLERMWQKGFASPHLTYFSEATLSRLVDASTNLQPVGHYYLPSIVCAGLRERIGASHGKLVSGILAGVIVGLLPVIRMLPQDIMVFMFRKPRQAHPTASPGHAAGRSSSRESAGVSGQTGARVAVAVDIAAGEAGTGGSRCPDRAETASWRSA